MTERSEWESLRERVLSEKGESSKGKVRFSERLKASVAQFTLSCSESREEVAKRLGVSHSALYAWVLKRHGRVRSRNEKRGNAGAGFPERSESSRVEPCSTEFTAGSCQVIGFPRGVEVFLYEGRCDMRKSFNTLSMLVEHEMKRDLLEGDLFLFVSKSRKRAKVLYFDGTGLCLFAKRLEKGKFPAPWKMRKLQLTLSELSLFIEGSSAVRQALSPPVLRKVDLNLMPVATESLCG